MLQGKTLQELAQEVDRQAKAKVDYLADTRKLRAVGLEEMDGVVRKIGNPVITLEPNVAMTITPIAHEQLASKLEIPKKYYDRMLTDAPDLWAKNVNHWFKSEPQVRMVRTMQYPGADTMLRAFLSDRYRRLDHIDLLGAILPELATRKNGVKVQSAEITESRLYLKFTFPDMVAEVPDLKRKVGDIVEFGLSIANSEIGLAAISICPMILRLSCLNGATIPDSQVRKFHIGRDGSADENFEVYSNETLKLDDQTFWAKVRDVVRALSQDGFIGMLMDRIMTAQGLPAIERPPAAIKQMVKAGSFYETDGEKILAHLTVGGDLSAWGLSQAVSRHSQDIPDYDRASSLEELAGKIITLEPGEWKVIANAN